MARGTSGSIESLWACLREGDQVGSIQLGGDASQVHQGWTGLEDRQGSRHLYKQETQRIALDWESGAMKLDNLRGPL